MYEDIEEQNPVYLIIMHESLFNFHFNCNIFFVHIFKRGNLCTRKQNKIKVRKKY